MSDTKLIEELCHIADTFSGIVLHLSKKLEMINALDEQDRIMIDAVLGEYSSAIGSDEAPDFLYDRVDESL